MIEQQKMLQIKTAGEKETIEKELIAERKSLRTAKDRITALNKKHDDYLKKISRQRAKRWEKAQEFADVTKATLDIAEIKRLKQYKHKAIWRIVAIISIIIVVIEAIIIIAG